MKIFNQTNDVKFQTTNNKKNLFAYYQTRHNMISRDCVSFGATPTLQTSQSDSVAKQVETLYKKRKLTNEDQIEAVQLYQKLNSEIKILKETLGENPDKLSSDKNLRELKEQQKMVAEALLNSIDKFIDKCIRNSSVQDKHFDDIKQYIIVELLKNIFTRFDADKMKGKKFLTYIGKCIPTKIPCAINEMKGIKQGSYLIQTNHIIETVINEFKIRTGMPPTDEELTRALQKLMNRPKLSIDTVKKIIEAKKMYSGMSLSVTPGNDEDMTISKIIKAPKDNFDEKNDSLHKRFFNVITKIAENNDAGTEQNIRIFKKRYKEEKQYIEIAKEEKMTVRRARQIVKLIKYRSMTIIGAEIKRHPELINTCDELNDSLLHCLEDDPEKLEKLIKHFENMSEEEISQITPTPNRELAIELLKIGKFSDEEVALKAELSPYTIIKIRKDMSILHNNTEAQEK